MANASLGLVLRQLRGLVDPPISDTLTDRQLLERFCGGQEEEAFATLLRRHGPMVLAVCRRVLGQMQDAEDAFQATFLLLARKAAHIRRGEAVSGWLHAVAVRLALRARAQASRRRQREHQAAALRPPQKDPRSAWQELEAVLDDELHKLPPAFRSALVLCYLEGKTQEEAARQLGCPLGTVRSRLARARRLLRDRLRRRGVTLSTAGLATALAASPARALPASLVHATRKAGLAYAAGQPATGVSPGTALLLKEGLKAMAPSKLKVGIALLLMAGLLGAGTAVLPDAALALRATAGAEAQAPAAAQAGSGKRAADGRAPREGARQAQPAANKPVILTGQVFTADGKPVAGARVAAVVHLHAADATGEQEQVLGNTTSDRQGRYSLSVRRIPPAQVYALNVVASAVGHGLGWKAIARVADPPELAVRLWPEQVVRGRLVNVQGQGAARVQVALCYALNPASKQPDGFGLYKPQPSLSPWPKPVTTDARGRFVLRGLGRGQEFGLCIRDERFGRQDLRQLRAQDDKPIVCLLEPPQVVEGRLTYSDTGKPVPGAGVVVRGFVRRVNQSTWENGAADATTDGQGRYRVLSYPGNHILVTAYPPAGTPYLEVAKELPWPREAVKQQVDLALPRGVVIRGKVVEAGSNKPVAGVRVEVFGRELHGVSAADGSFRLVVAPGQGHLLCRHSGHYIQQMIFRNFATGKITPEPVVYPRIAGKSAVQILYPDGQRLHVVGWHAYNLKPADEPVEVKVALRRGVTVHGRLVGPEGKPVAHARMLCELPVCTGLVQVNSVDVRDGRFTLTGCDPAKKYPVLFVDPEHEWGAFVHISARQAALKPVTVRLAPCGSAEIRFFKTAGQPLANYRLNILGAEVLLPPVSPVDPKAARGKLLSPDHERLISFNPLHYRDEMPTDGQGRFVLRALIPGATYRFTYGGPLTGYVREFKAEPGKVVRLEDIVFRQS